MQVRIIIEEPQFHYDTREVNTVPCGTPEVSIKASFVEVASGDDAASGERGKTDRICAISAFPTLGLPSLFGLLLLARKFRSTGFTYQDFKLVLAR